MKDEPTKSKLRGVFAPVTTPFEESGKVDAAGLRFNMDRYANSGLKGYLALGSNGENKSLTGEEKRRVLDVIIQNKAPNQIVMAGCIAESTRETIHLARMAEELGADFATLLPPSYFKKQMTDGVLYRYFTEVADAVGIPCLLYCAPQFTGGITLSPSLVASLAAHQNIVGMKDSSVGNMDSYLLAVPETFAVLAGSANFFLSALLNGAVGGVISLANVIPDYVSELYMMFVSGNYENCFARNREMIAMNKAVSGKGGVAAVKAAMDLAGYVGGDPRLPLLPLDKSGRDSISAALRTRGLIGEEVE